MSAQTTIERLASEATGPLINWRPLSKPWHRNTLILSGVFFLAVGGVASSMYLGFMPTPDTVHLISVSFTLTKTVNFGIGVAGESSFILSFALAGVAEFRRRKVIKEAGAANLSPDIIEVSGNEED